MINEVKLIQGEYENFLAKLRAEILRLQEDGYVVDVQYGGRTRIGLHTALVIARAA